MDADKIRDTLWQAEMSLSLLEFALRFEGYCNRNPKPESLQQFIEELSLPHICTLPEGTLSYDEQFTEERLIFFAGIGIANAFGVSAQILNRAYEEVGIKLITPPTNNAESIRFYINQVRCIFQHAVGSPLWDIWPKKRIAIDLCVNGKARHIDFAVLHGKEFDYEQIGGLPYWVEIAVATIGELKTLAGIGESM